VVRHGDWPANTRSATRFVTDSDLLPSPEPGELGRTIVTDVLVGESEQVRIVARQVVLFRSCIGLRLELIRWPGSSIENWWGDQPSRAAPAEYCLC